MNFKNPGIFSGPVNMFVENLWKSIEWFPLQRCRYTDRHFVKFTFFSLGDPKRDLRTILTFSASAKTVVGFCKTASMQQDFQSQSYFEELKTLHPLLDLDCLFYCR